MNTAARGSDQPGADAVALGQRGVFGALFDLHPVEFYPEPAEHRRLPRHQQQGTACEHAVALTFLLHQSSVFGLWSSVILALYHPTTDDR